MLLDRDITAGEQRRYRQVAAPQPGGDDEIR
jgi:hypothetical protein